jgi:hypothetical protein
MTLSPVFRSEKAVEILGDKGIWDQFEPAMVRQAAAVDLVHNDLLNVIGESFIELDESAEPGLDFLQDYFFLTLFISLFESLGVLEDRLPFYAELDFCIMGTITAADNLFDDQDKSLLPLKSSAGARYRSILQLMSFERLIRRVGDRAVGRNQFSADAFSRVQLQLMNLMAGIGKLEGSEEGGVDEIPEPSTMLDRVHRVRGGELFGLAFAAPLILEEGPVREQMQQADPAVRQLGTAFQIVDDLTDFEFDVGRGSHNLLVSRIHHAGRADEKDKLNELLSTGAVREEGLVAGLFADSARWVLDVAQDEARAAFESLSALGYWFPPGLADEVVHAIVGLDGVARMESLTK